MQEVVTLVDAARSAPNILIIEKDEYTLSIGDTEKISFSSDLLVTFESDNPDVVTVDENGNMTAISAGTAQIKLQTIAQTKYVTVTVTGNSTIPTDAVATLYGDINLDNKVSSVDVVLLNKYLLSNTEYPLSELSSYANADCKYDGIIDLNDSTMITNNVLGITLLSELGLNKNLIDSSPMELD